jgi:hypothetical protein
MNSPTEADAEPRFSFQPGRLWSVFDVLKLYATSFIALGEQIGSADAAMGIAASWLSAPVQTGGRVGGFGGEAAYQAPDPLVIEQLTAAPEAEELIAIDDLDLSGAKGAVEALRQVVLVAERLELPISAELISKTIEREQELTHGEYRLLKQALYTEIKGKALFYCPRERSGYFENDRILSDSAKLAFPTAYVELREAGSCFAASRFTGAVLHCMRAAEVGVKAMARALGHNPADLAQQDWHPVLNKCESLITEMRNTLPKGVRKEVELQFFSQAAAQFRNFKDGWRVQAAHARPPFNEGEAKIILDATISFYEVLALRLSEDAQEIGPEQVAP